MPRAMICTRKKLGRRFRKQNPARRSSVAPSNREKRPHRSIQAYRAVRFLLFPHARETPRGEFAPFRRAQRRERHRGSNTAPRLEQTLGAHLSPKNQTLEFRTRRQRDSSNAACNQPKASSPATGLPRFPTQTPGTSCAAEQSSHRARRVRYAQPYRGGSCPLPPRRGSRQTPPS